MLDLGKTDSIEYKIPKPSEKHPFLRFEKNMISQNSHVRIQSIKVYNFFKHHLNTYDDKFQINLKFISKKYHDFFIDKVNASISGEKRRGKHRIYLRNYFKALLERKFLNPNDLKPGNILRFTKLYDEDTFKLEIIKKPLKGILTSKEEDFSAWYTELINKAELADIRYNIKGFVIYREWATLTIRKMYKKTEELLEKKGHLPLTMPSLIPESNFLLEAEHVKGFSPEVFWVTEAGSEKEPFQERLALRPTSETALYPMYSLWIQSYKDLPFKRYLSCQVWRYEGKMTRPFFRGREFHWIESHNVFATMEEAMEQVKEDMETTYQILQEECCIPIIFFERPQWDKFSGALKTFAADALMGSGKVLQLPSTHLLGQNFSKPFNVKFIDKDGEEIYGYQTCYGPAQSRNYGAMIAYLGDDNGLILPFDLAPIQIVIIPILFKGKEELILTKAKEIFELLRGKYTVKFDDSDKSSGVKFYYWELKGVPIRIEIGPKDIEKQQIIIVKRHDGRRFTVKDKDLENKISEIAENYTKEIKNKSLIDFESQIELCYEIDSAKEAIEKGKIVCCGFCSIDMEAYHCAEVVEKEVGGFVRGKRVDEEKHEFATCLVCGKPASCTVYIAKSY